MKKVVLVTGIGGNVGQGILRNIRSFNSQIKLIGSNIEQISAGNHFCDQNYVVPYAYDKDYISEVEKIVDRESVDLIIPSTDYEALYLAKSKLSTISLVPNYESVEILLDKYKTWIFFEANGIPFAKSYLPKKYKEGTFSEFIIKPREGRGSRGLAFNPKDLSIYNDEYIVQNLYKGIELTCAVYVDKNGNIHGLITLQRELVNGATNNCWVNDDYDDQLQEIALKMVEKMSLRGAFNIQAIVENGVAVPFEINCRISGTNSIRSQFGFKDVQYAIQEYLFDEVPQRILIVKGSATRVLMDVIYPGCPNLKESTSQTESYLY